MLEEALRQTNEYRRLREALAGGRSPVALFGLPPAARAQTAAALAADLGRPAVVLTAGEAAATRFAADAAFFGARSAVCPARDFALRPTLGQSREFEYRRIAVLGSIVGGRCNLLAAPLEGALQLTMPRADFEANTLTLKEGQTFKQQELVARLVSAGYHRRDKVEGPGQFSVRGGIVDLYPPDMDRPARVEFWGDAVDTMSGFDLLTQRREVQLKKVYVSPAREVLFSDPAEAAGLLRDAADRLKGAKKARLEMCIRDRA